MPDLSSFTNTLNYPRARCMLMLCSLILGLTACSNEQSSPADASVTLTPRQAQLFQQTCANCHTRPGTGAPQAGDLHAWEKILEKGLELTLERTINGYGGMPPGGQCFECTPEDLSQLILFMSQASSNNPLSNNPLPTKPGAAS